MTPDINTTCLFAPCNTLNHYSRNRLIESDSIFVFMPGTHHLEMDLTLNGATNVTFEGSRELTTTVVLVGSAQIALTNCRNITASSLEFDSVAAARRSDLSANGMVSVLDSEDVTFLNVGFRGNDTATGSLNSAAAVVSVNSTLSFTEVQFTSCRGGNGGALTATDNSTVIFHGNNSFVRNMALGSGGAVYAESSHVIFRGRTLFLDNAAMEGGGAVMARWNSSVSFDGNHTFIRNSVAYAKDSTHTDRGTRTPHGGGAIALVGSKMAINGLVNFSSNTAPNGGAVLAQDSVITSSEAGNIAFSGNTVVEKTNRGGGGGGAGPASNDTGSEMKTIGSGYGGSVWASETEIRLSSRTTFSNSSASYGGDVYVEFSELTLSGSTSSISSTAEVDGGGLYLNNTRLRSYGELEVSGNTAHYKGSAVYAYKSTVMASGTVVVRDCFQLDLELEGTLYFDSTTVNFSGQTYFRNNTAYDGGAIYALNSTITMENNTTLIGNRAELNGGGFYLEQSRLGLQDMALMRGNHARAQGGCIYSSFRSIVFLSGRATYERNEANEGGVFAMENGANMVLSEPLHLTAAGNLARENGGVIFYADVISTSDCAAVLVHSDSSPLPVCFLELNATVPFDVTTWNVRLNFTRNVAMTAGSVLYGGNLARCRMLVSETLNLDLVQTCNVVENGFYEMNPLSIIGLVSSSSGDNTPVHSIISSAPLRICFCENNVPNCDLVQTVRVRRGEMFQLSAVAVGQGGNGKKNSVPSNIMTEINSSVEIATSQRSQVTSVTCTGISYQLYTKMDSITLVLYPDGPCRDTGIARTRVHVVLEECPDGFERSPSKTGCVCDSRLKPLNAMCDVTDRTINIRGGTWLRPVYLNETYAGLTLHLNCPYDYCLQTATSIRLNDTDTLCNHNRTGVLCGACKRNYSLALGSFHCLHCSNSYLSLLIPFALAGVVLVVLLLVLDLTVAKGTINGLILYANIVQANKAVFLPAEQKNILTVFIAWLNLDLGIESCFFDGLTAYTHTWLQFAFPLYLWFLISLIIVFSHKSRHVTKWLSTNPVAVLATLLLMSYGKILQTIICALSRTYLDTPTGFRAVWVYDGNMDYFASTRHVVLAMVAIVALIVLFLPYSLLLMFGWKLQSHSNRRLFSWISKLKPFMDTIYGPFRPEMRYWTGLLLVIRCALLLTFAFNGLSPSVQSTTSTNLLAVTAIFTALAVLAWLCGRIYNTLYMDVLEAASILNTIMFAAATYHVKNVKGDQAALAHTSISISFVLFVGIVLHHVYLRVKDRDFWTRLQVELTVMQKYHKLKSLVCLRKKPEANGATGEDIEVSLIPGQEPTTSYVTLREPLLEN